MWLKIITLVIICSNAFAQTSRIDIHNGAGQLVGWILVTDEWERVYQSDAKLKGWYITHIDRTYKADGTLFSFGKRLTDLINK